MTFRESQGYSIYIEEADYERKGSVCMKKGVLKGIVCLVVIVVCRVQVMEIKK